MYIGVKIIHGTIIMVCCIISNTESSEEELLEDNEFEVFEHFNSDSGVEIPSFPTFRSSCPENTWS